MSTELISSTIANIPREFSPQVADSVKQRWDSLTKPRGSLGRLETEVLRLAQIQDTDMPHIERPYLYVFCGDHGVTAENVSPYPSVVTREMVRNFLGGGAAINVLCRKLGIQNVIVDAGVGGPKIPGVLDCRMAEGTRNFLREPAMSLAQTVESIAAGITLAQQAIEQADLAGVGEMGIGNSTSAAALLCALVGATPEQAVGRGAGLDENGLRHKRSVVSSALALHREVIEEKNPLCILAAFGGFEIAMMSGFLLGAAAHRLPVVVDGFIAGAAFLAAQAFYSGLANHVFFAHRSAEPGHALVLKSASPLLDLGLRLGEGTGAALAIALLRSGLQLYREMATFSEASVSNKATAH